MKVSLSRAAQKDIVAAIRYLADQNPYAARRLEGDLSAAIGSLEQFSNRERQSQNGLRRIMCGRYLIFYRTFRDEVLIVRIVHSARLSAATLSEDE